MIISTRASEFLRFATRCFLRKKSLKKDLLFYICEADRYLARSRHHKPVPPTATVAVASGIFLFSSLLESTSLCDSEDNTTKRRRRPPKFGCSIPNISARGFITTTDDNKITTIPPKDSKDRSDCPLCKKFGSGPCGGLFHQWLSCTDSFPGKGSNGEPLHLKMCQHFADKLARCLESNEDYYSKNETEKNDESPSIDTIEELKHLKEAWSNFVQELENGIKLQKYKASPFPEDISPRMEVRFNSSTGVAYFKPAMEDGSEIIAAYVLDDHGNLLAAGSSGDMDMGNLGCVLQFDVLGETKLATACAIYDTMSEPVTIFSRTMVVPPRK